MAVEADVAANAPSNDKSVKEQAEDREEDLEADADHEVDDLADSKPKKKRRVIKLSDKKYECPQPDCGKSYSRAEHLYRHQLNRTYKCRSVVYTEAQANGNRHPEANIPL